MASMGDMMDAPLGEGPPPKMGMGLDDNDGDESGPLDEFETEATVALDPDAPMADRLMALKEAIRICAEQDAAGGYDKPPPKKGEGPDLAIVFGGPEKKRK